ncbi:MAG: hypothetical protein KAR20_09680 [Candidatus Heimdallarchaeota archaeon]|nr:hypothetical protein [Candidatus Heimdallarchaeota archaeon]
MIVVDTSSIFYGSMHTHGLMEYDGQGTGIIYGFFSQMMSWYKKFNDPSFCWAWDSSKSERIRIFPMYKYNRRHKEREPDEIELLNLCFPQLHLLRKHIFPRIGVKNSFRQVGYEADDVLASIVYNNAFHPRPLMISGDEDMFQCLNACSIYSPSKKIMISQKSFVDEYGINPRDWTMVKQIGGCKTDEVPGVDGVGEKTAIEFIKGKLPSHYKKYDKIQAATELIEFNHQLVALPMAKTRVFKIGYQQLDIDELYDVFEEYGMERFLKNFRDWEGFIDDANSEAMDQVQELAF